MAKSTFFANSRKKYSTWTHLTHALGLRCSWQRSVGYLKLTDTARLDGVCFGSNSGYWGEAKCSTMSDLISCAYKLSQPKKPISFHM